MNMRNYIRTYTYGTIVIFFDAISAVISCWRPHFGKRRDTYTAAELHWFADTEWEREREREPVGGTGWRSWVMECTVTLLWGNSGFSLLTDLQRRSKSYLGRLLFTVIRRYYFISSHNLNMINLLILRQRVYYINKSRWKLIIINLVQMKKRLGNFYLVT